jgi:PleD family two-component response regulator
MREPGKKREMDQANAGKVMIADDDADNLVELIDFLTSSGFEAHGACNGETLIAKAMESTPDLILLDIKMPVMDGYETCRRLKANDSTRDVPVIFLTGLSETHNKVMGFEAGGVDYITKPFDIEEITSRINTHVTLHRLQKEREKIITELREALSTVKQLSGMLPICMFCKKIRNDKGYWEQVEQYISEHSEVEFTHGLCEECSKKHFPDLHEA